MNAWAEGFLGPPDRRRLASASSRSRRGSTGRAASTSTTATSGARDGEGFSAPRSSTSSLYVVANAATLRAEGRSVVLYLPKIQVAAEAAVWAQLLDALEAHLGLPAGHDPRLRPRGAARGGVPAAGDPRRPRAPLRRLQHRALGLHQLGVRRPPRRSGASSNPNIDAITMTYAYMRAYEDRVRRAVNTPDAGGPVRAVAGRDGGADPGRLARRRRCGDGEGRRGRRARAARGRERQVGRPLEDGPHRPARSGSAPARTTSWAARSRR